MRSIFWGLLLTCGLVAHSAWAQPTSGAVGATGTPAASGAASADAADADPACAYLPRIDLLPLDDDVYYTVVEPHSFKTQLGIWGLRIKTIQPLNPTLEANTMLDPGQKILVYSRSANATEPLSVGRANAGTLRNARIMPEGEGYRLRLFRQRSWGTDTTIQALTTALHAFHEKYPDAPLINVGEISKPDGGPLDPHLSHQAGRDVDVGFVFKEEPHKHHPEHFEKAKPKNFDAEKTWYFVECLIRTGAVQMIFVDESVQKMLYEYAAPRLTKQQLGAIFPRHGNALFHAWPGHTDHFHVRFHCPPGQPKCKE